MRLRVCDGYPGRNHLHVLYLPSSHASVVENMQLLSEEGVRVEPLPVRDYRVDTDALRKMLREETMLVSMDAVCAETGVVWNTREVADVLRNTKREKKQSMRPESSKEPKKRLLTPLLHVDASQAPLTEKITRDHFGADLLTFDAAKVGPVRSVGILVAHRTVPLEPLYRGGGQERGVRPGTGNPEAAAQFAQALSKVTKRREKFVARAEGMRARLVEGVTKTLPEVQVQAGKTQVPNIVNFSFIGRDTDYLVALLDEAGFAVATKSACETDSENGSRAVQVLTNDGGRASATLRVSWGPHVSGRALKRFMRVLIREVQFIDSVARR